LVGLTAFWGFGHIL